MNITKDEMEFIQTEFPKFGKEAKCMINNPQYGITLTPKAQKMLNKHRRQSKYGSNVNRLTIRLCDEDYKLMKKKIGTTSVQDYVEKLIKEDLSNDYFKMWDNTMS